MNSTLLYLAILSQLRDSVRHFTLVRRIADFFEFLFFFFFFSFKFQQKFVLRPISFRSISSIPSIHRKLKTSRQYLYYIGIELSHERDQYPGFQ